MILEKYLIIFKDYLLKIIDKIDKCKVAVYIIYFLIYFIIYYSIIVPKIFKPFESKYKDRYIYSIIGVDVIYIIALIGLLVYYFKNMDKIVGNKKIIFILIPILISGVIVFFNVYIFNKYLKIISKSPITKYVYVAISTLFYIIFLALFTYNINTELNIEFLLSIQILLLFFIEYVIIMNNGFKNIYSHLKNDDFSLITVNCFGNNNIEKYSTDSPNNSSQLESISKEYGDNYLKTIGNIPIAFYNEKINDYQDLILADFYYPGSYYTYLANSPLDGTPNLEAIKVAISDFKCRIIHLDVYSDKVDPYDPNALPIIKCENMKDGAIPLVFDEVLGLINKWAWINNDANNLSYPFFLYLNFKFNQDNQQLFVRIYESLLKFFSKYFVDKKYSFSGRNSTFSISMAKIKECLGKIIIISNIYPTKTALDELINISTNTLNNDLNFHEYKADYIKYEKTGISQDNDRTTLVNNSKTSINVYYSLPNNTYKNNSQAKAGLFNPSFQDCAQYGIQSTLMYVFVPDDNLRKWNAFFKNKNNLNPVLKDQLLRSLTSDKITVQSQNPVVGLQKPQKYCVVPGLISTEKSNLSGGVSNNSCT